MTEEMIFDTQREAIVEAVMAVVDEGGGTVYVHHEDDPDIQHVMSLVCDCCPSMITIDG